MKLEEGWPFSVVPNPIWRTFRAGVSSDPSMVLLDTSVWVDHLRVRNEILLQLLIDENALMHPFVAGEIALGTLP